jgi:DNA polymerase-3 subunit beta
MSVETLTTKPATVVEPATLAASGTLGAFLAAVKASGAGIPARVPAPILLGVRIGATVGMPLMFSRFDYETATVAAVVGSDVRIAGEVLVNHKMLLDVLTAAGKRATKRVSDAWPVSITVAGNLVTVDVNGTVYTLTKMDLADYPELPDMASTEVVTVDPAAFIARMDSALTAASTDDTLPILTSIRMEFEPGNLTLFATDRYRLTMVELPTVGSLPVGSARFLLRAKSWKAFKRVLSAKGEPIELHYHSDSMERLTIRQGSVELNSLCIDGDYPRIRSLFPDSTPIVFEMGADDLAAAVAAVAVTAERNTPVKLTYNGINSLRVQAGTGEAAQAESFLPYEGLEGNRGFAVCFNPHFLADALKDLKGQRIRFAHTTAPKPALIEPATGDASTVRHLLMPVRLPS